jgi:curli biogenesis system outer membrane secretion channel CsgG
MVLMQTGRFTLVDRTVVDRLLDEQEFSYSGVVDVGTAAELGRMMGAEAVMTVNVVSVEHDDFWDNHPAQRDAELHVKIISVETSEVLYSAAGEGSDFDGASGAMEQALDDALLPLGRN